MELESKLAAYRANKKREEKLNNLKDGFKKFINWTSKPKTDENITQKESLLQEVTERQEKPIFAKVESRTEKEPLDKKQITVLKTIFYITGLIIWGSLYYFFIRMQFGIIFLIISALFGIYFNTRTGPRDENEVSAYSVFNKNCESIDGTLKAEQFEREIRFGAL